MNNLVEKLRFEIPLNAYGQELAMRAAADELERLQARVAELEKDKEQLDFIDSNGCDWNGMVAYINGTVYSKPTLRECIDDAMISV